MAGGLFTLMVATAFTVDLGRLMVRNREMQAIADVATIEASRAIDGRTVQELQPVVDAIVAQAAARNDESDADFVVQLGTYDTYNREFILHTNPGDVPNAVRVVPDDDVDYFFMPGAGNASRDAIGLQLNVTPNPPPPPPTGPPPPALQPVPPVAGFTVGSYLAGVDTSQAALLNTVVSTGLLPVAAPAVTFDAVSWQGLGAARVTFGDLALALGAATPSELIAASPIPVFDFVDGMARVLQSDGDLTSSATLNSLLAVIDPSQTVDLGDLLFVATGADEAAATSELQVARLITASAFLADDDHAITVPSFSAGVPGITSTAITLEVIESPVYVAGPVPTAGVTRQVHATIVNQVSIGLPSIAGILGATLTGSLVVDLQGAGAVATSTAIACGDSKRLDLSVVSSAVDSTTSLTGSLFVDLLLVDVNEGIGLEGTKTGSDVAAPLSFAYTSEFDIPPSSYGPKRVGPHTLALDTTSLSFTDGISSPLLSALLTPLNSALTGVTLPALLAGVDANVVSPLSQQLGLSFGGADVWANALTCNAPILVP